MILITGGTGFVGSHLLLKLLEKEVNVRAMYRNHSKIAFVQSLFDYYGKSAQFLKIEWVEADITDIPSLENAFADVTHVYHCAALISFDPADEELLRKTNIEGTANIVNMSLSRNVKKLCFVSSIAALGDLRENETVITEETEWNPEKFHSDYAISKYGAEIEVWRAQQESLDVVVVNPGFIIGPCEPNNGSGQLFSKSAKGIKYYTNGCSGFVAVEDVANIMVMLMEHNIASEKFILVGENLTFKDLLTQTACALHVKPPTKCAKKWMTGLLWRLDMLVSGLTGKKRKLSKATAKSLHSTDAYSSEKILETIQFEFTPIKKSIATTAAYFLVSSRR